MSADAAPKAPAERCMEPTRAMTCPDLSRGHLPEAPVAQRPRARRRSRAAREGIRHLALDHLGRVQRRVPAPSRSACASSGIGARRRGRADRRQPAGLGDGRDRGARARRHERSASTATLWTTRSPTCSSSAAPWRCFAEDEEQVDKLLDVSATACRHRPAHHLLRPARHAEVFRPAPAAGHRADAARRCRRTPNTRRSRTSWWRRRSGEDVAILCTTSGTTAQPKLAMLTGRRADPPLRELP